MQIQDENIFFANKKSIRGIVMMMRGEISQSG